MSTFNLKLISESFPEKPIHGHKLMNDGTNPFLIQ